jgi:DNA-binding GntR family transcriptional regulator
MSSFPFIPVSDDSSLSFALQCEKIHNERQDRHISMTSRKESSIFDTVYTTIKNKILHLEFRPGKPISVATLADALQVSRTPVHDAILKLSNENLIDVFPKSGSRVSLIDIKRTEDERFIRKALELSAIREMFYNYDESYLSTMETCIKEHELAFKENRYIDTLYWDSQFHFQIFRCIHKEYCWEIGTRYSANEYRVRLLAEKAIATTQEFVLQNHRDIVRFLRDRNLDAVLQIEEQHLARITTEITTLVAAYPALFTTANDTSIPQKIRTKEDFTENFLDTIQPIGK